MLPTDQSGLIELRLAVLRPANDRRDISAASGMFVRQCARVNEQRQNGKQHKEQVEERKGKAILSQFCRNSVAIRKIAKRVIFIKLRRSSLFFFLSFFSNTTTIPHVLSEIFYRCDPLSRQRIHLENQRRKMSLRAKRIFITALRKIINFWHHDVIFLVDVYVTA